MLILLSDEHRADLEFFETQDVDILHEFSELTEKFLTEGVNTKVYTAAAGKMGISAHVIRKAVEGLMFLLIESSKLQVSDLDFVDSIQVLGFPESHVNKLLVIYKGMLPMIRKL